LILGVSGASIPYSLTRSLVFSGVVTWTVSPSETLVTVPVTVRIGSRAKERDVGNDLPPKSDPVFMLGFWAVVPYFMVRALDFVSSTE
jgi:hypothetical protein